MASYRIIPNKGFAQYVCRKYNYSQKEGLNLDFESMSMKSQYF